MVFLFRGFLFKVLPTIRFSAFEVFFLGGGFLYILQVFFFNGFCSRKEKCFFQRGVVLFYVYGVLFLVIKEFFFQSGCFFFFEGVDVFVFSCFPIFFVFFEFFSTVSFFQRLFFFQLRFFSRFFFKGFLFF